MANKADPERPITYRERDALHEAVIHCQTLYGGGTGWAILLAMHVGEFFDRTKLGKTGIPGYVESCAKELELKRTQRRVGR